MKTIRRFLAAIALTLAAWCFLRRWHATMHGKWPVPPSPEAGWDPTAAKALEDYIKSPAGAALIAHLRWTDLRTTAHAVYGHNQTREFRCGYAAGYRAAVSYLVTLSTTRPAAEAGTEPDGDGAADLLERLAP